MNPFARTGGLSAGVLGLALLAGCSGSSEATVSGEVFVDGQPLQKGRIQFFPPNGQVAAADAPIADGKYTASVAPGDYKVKISGDKVVGQLRMAPESPPVDDVREMVAAKYNDQTELSMTVQKGSQQKRWDVQARK
jgi:hypothetical protein